MTSLVHPRGVGMLQRWFFERVSRSDAEDAEDERLVLGGELPAHARLDIYRRAYVTRLVECLADDYPAVAHALGASTFEAVCCDYIAQNPPASSSLNFYGAAFADFCAALSGPPDAGFVADLARLEWALVEVIHADAQPALDPTRLARVTADEWPRLRLVPSPALRLIRCSYPVHRYYRAFVEEEAAAPVQRGPGGVAVCRQGDDVWRFGLEPAAVELLGQLCAGSPLGSALAAFEAIASEQDAAALQQTLSDWVAAGFFASVALD